jgi:uncharacterized protein (TIGR02001 family)
MNKLALVSAVAASLALPIAGHAAEQSDHTFTGNVGIFSNYIFRGVSQTSEKPAVQGGFDYAHASGFYAGTWGSNVSWLSDFTAYTGSSVELDVYGGYKSTIGKSDFGFDVGAIYYYYPGDKNTSLSADTAEVYGALSWKWVTAKISYVTGDYFGIADADGTMYFDVSASYPIGKSGVTLLAHVGSLKMSGTGNDVLDYTDWKVGATYALPKDFIIGAVYSDADADETLYSPTGENWVSSQVAVYLQKTF